MENKVLYRLLVVVLFILLMTVGIYLGLEITDKATNDEESAQIQLVNTKPQEIQVYDEDDEKEEVLDEVKIKLTEVYPECGHNIDLEETYENVSKEEMKKQIADRDITYRLVDEQNNILIFQRVHEGKCMNHYKVCLEEEVVNIYRMSESGEFVLYQATEVTSAMLREGIKERLQEGILVDDVEELFLLMEDIES